MFMTRGSYVVVGVRACPKSLQAFEELKVAPDRYFQEKYLPLFICGVNKERVLCSKRPKLSLLQN